MRHERDHDQTAMHAEASIQAQSALKGALAAADQRAETAELALQDALAKVDLTTKWEEDSSHELRHCAGTTLLISRSCFCDMELRFSDWRDE